MSKENEEIGVALAGGGLQGLSHIGALKALEELGVKIKYISGTSTGSIIASLYAMGYTPDEMQILFESNLNKILKMKKSVLFKIAMNYLFFKETKTEGIIDGRIISNLINNAAKEKNINLIKDVKSKKLAIATVDTKTMKECIFVSDKVNNKNPNINYISNIDVGTAVRASMAFPAIFTTVNFDKYNFIDGGTVDNLPSKVLKDMGAEKVISICFDLNHYNPSKNLEGVLVRALDIFSYSDVEEGKKMSDVSIEIYNPDTSLLTVKDIKKTIENGYNAVCQWGRVNGDVLF